MLDSIRKRNFLDLSALDGLKRHHPGGSQFSRAELRPRCHQSPPLLEHVASLVRGFDLVADHVGQRRFDDFLREIRTLSCPRPKRRSETVCRYVTALHPAQHHQ